jgi:hypothetical protein
MYSDCDVPHWYESGIPDVDASHWLWAPEAIEALPWADKYDQLGAQADPEDTEVDGEADA